MQAEGNNIASCSPCRDTSPFPHGLFDKGCLEDREYESKLTNQLKGEHDYTTLET